MTLLTLGHAIILKVSFEGTLPKLFRQTFLAQQQQPILTYEKKNCLFFNRENLLLQIDR
jgi:hypothetical protein